MAMARRSPLPKLLAFLLLLETPLDPDLMQ